MDEVVALSTLLRDRHVHAPPASTRVDAIPPLTRSLPQVAADSARLLSARLSAASPQSPALSVHPAALRLFASVGFDPHVLRRAVSSVHAASPFVDVPPRTPGSHRHLAAIPPRALDDARLAAAAALALAAQADLVHDLQRANARLVSRLASAPPAGRPAPQRHLFAPDDDRPEGPAALDIALAVHHRYVDVARAVALDAQPHSAPFLMHEAAVDVRDAPHLVEMLAVLASVARFAATPRPPPHLLVWGARVVLEDQFAETVPNMPQKPRTAAPAPIVQAVTDYVHALQKERKLKGACYEEGDNGHDHQHHHHNQPVPLWPRVFYCLRVGNARAALAVLESADAVRDPLARKLIPYFDEFAVGRDRVRNRFWDLSHSDGDARMADDIKDEGAPMTPGMLCTEAAHESLARLYAAEAWPSNDPYLRASIALLMRLEILHSYDDALEGTEGRMPSHSPGPSDQAHSLALPDEDIAGLLASVEDYLWFRLWLCRPPLEREATLGQWTSKSDFVNLTEIQENMRVCGSKHFDPEGTQPLVYAFVLVCCGLHEEAVSYLTSHANEHLMHAAVHIAIVLYQLRWIDDDMAFHAILARYISNFSRLFPTEAALYLMTLRDRDMLRQSLKELILETGEYELLTKGDGDGVLLGALGNLPPRGKELPSGLTATDIENIRVETAHVGALEAAQRGEFAIAAELYKLSGELAESAEMTMRNLAEVVDKQSSSRRAPAIVEAQKVLQSCCATNFVATSIAALLKTSEFFEEYWKGRYQSAWDALRHTGVVPLAAADIANCRWDLAGSQAKFDHCLHDNTLQMLQLALNIAEVALEQNEVQHLDSPPGCGDNSTHEIRGNPPLPYRSEMKALCMFAGCIQIADAVTSEKLIRIEMLLSR